MWVSRSLRCSDTCGTRPGRASQHAGIPGNLTSVLLRSREAREDDIVAALEGLQRGGQEQVAARRTVELAFLDEPAASGQPSAGARHLPPEQECQPQPERTPGRIGRVLEAQALKVCALPGLRALVVLADEVRRDGQPLEILDIEWPLLAGGGVQLVGVGPGLAPERRTPRSIVPATRRLWLIRESAAPDRTSSSTTSRRPLDSLTTPMLRTAAADRRRASSEHDVILIGIQVRVVHGFAANVGAPDRRAGGSPG